MTKKDIIDAMKDLSDDAQVYVYCTSLDSDGGHYAEDLYRESSTMMSPRARLISR